MQTRRIDGRKKQKCGIVLAVLLSVCLLTGCSAGRVLGVLYGEDEVSLGGQDSSYQEYEGENGVNVVYDLNTWETPYMVEDGVVGVFSGNSISYTAVLLQTTDTYDDFLTQSAEDLSAETPTVEYEWDITIPDAEVQSVRYDCGSYQTMFAEVTYDSGLTVYVTAATHSSSTEAIEALLQCVYPAGAQPENAAALLSAASEAK